EQSMREYEAWRARHEETIATGATASVSVVRVTELSDEPPPAPVAIGKTTRREVRSRGRRYGTLVHAILRDAPWTATRQDLERLAALYRAVGAATEWEESDAVESAAAALADPLLRLAAA